MSRRGNLRSLPCCRASYPADDLTILLLSQPGKESDVAKDEYLEELIRIKEMTTDEEADQERRAGVWEALGELMTTAQDIAK